MEISARMMGGLGWDAHDTYRAHSPSSLTRDIDYGYRQMQPLSSFMGLHHHHHHLHQHLHLPDAEQAAAHSLSHCVYGSHPNSVARRNERERNRVRFINHSFVKLRQHLPFSDKKKNLSKVETLRTAIKYIRHLQHILTEQEKEEEEANCIKDSCKVVESSCGKESQTRCPASTHKSAANDTTNSVAMCGDFNSRNRAGGLHEDERSCSSSSSSSSSSSMGDEEEEDAEEAWA